MLMNGKSCLIPIIEQTQYNAAKAQLTITLASVIVILKIKTQFTSG